jgi:NADPH-ferrihemoprotein reductase
VDRSAVSESKLAEQVIVIQMGGAASKKPNIEPQKSRSRYSNLEEKYPAGKMSIYFGSQTGTAMGFARTLSNSFRKNGFDAKVVDLGDFDPQQLLSSRIAIFLVASYGEGDPTDNALRFYEWLCNTKGSLSGEYLANVSYAVFGLGNSTYAHYNQMGKNCDEKLALIGAHRLYPFGCGDDSCSLEEDFETWKANIIPFLTQKYLPVQTTPIDSCANYPKVHLTFTTVEVSPGTQSTIPFDINTATKYFFSCSTLTLTQTRDLRSYNDSGRTLHLELDASQSNLNYSPADNLAVIPENEFQVVESFSRCCGGYDLKKFVSLVPVSENEDVEFADPEEGFRHPFPNPCSIQTIFSLYLDICGIPRRSTIERFAGYITDPIQRQWLENILSKENRDRYTEVIESEGRSYASLLERELSSCIIPLEDLLHLIPLIQPRFYTISSSNSLYPTSIHLTGELFDFSGNSFH